MSEQFVLSEKQALLLAEKEVQAERQRIREAIEANIKPYDAELIKDILKIVDNGNN